MFRAKEKRRTAAAASSPQFQYSISLLVPNEKNCSDCRYMTNSFNFSNFSFSLQHTSNVGLSIPTAAEISLERWKWKRQRIEPIFTCSHSTSSAAEVAYQNLAIFFSLLCRLTLLLSSRMWRMCKVHQWANETFINNIHPRLALAAADCFRSSSFLISWYGKIRETSLCLGFGLFC